MSEILSPKFNIKISSDSSGSIIHSVYMSIYYQLVDDIIDGKYKVGDVIPTQNELAERFGVSRVTVREAIKELIRRNIVVTVKGKGTFVVACPTAVGTFMRADGYSRNRYMGIDKRVKSKIIEISVLPANEQLATELMISERSLVTRIMRLHLLDDNSTCLDDTYLVNKYLNNINFHDEDLENGSLYELLENKANIKLDFIEEKVRAVSCSADVARYLKIIHGEPVLHIRRRSFDAHGNAIEYCENYQRSDIYYMVVQTKCITIGRKAGGIESALCSENDKLF